MQEDTLWDLSSAFAKSSVRLSFAQPQQAASKPTGISYSSDVQLPEEPLPEPIPASSHQEDASPIIKQTVNPFDFANHTAIPPPPPTGVAEDTWTNTVTAEVRGGEGRGR